MTREDPVARWFEDLAMRTRVRPPSPPTPGVEAGDTTGGTR